MPGPESKRGPSPIADGFGIAFGRCFASRPTCGTTRAPANTAARPRGEIGRYLAIDRMIGRRAAVLIQFANLCVAGAWSDRYSVSSAWYTVAIARGPARAARASTAGAPPSCRIDCSFSIRSCDRWDGWHADGDRDNRLGGRGTLRRRSSQVAGFASMAVSWRHIFDSGIAIVPICAPTTSTREFCSIWFAARRISAVP